MPPTDTIPTPAATPEAKIIAELAREGVHKHALMQIDSDSEADIAPRLVWPDKTITNLEGALAYPLRKRGSAKMVDAESFAAYVNAHKSSGTVITGDADENGGWFTSLLDYHDPDSIVAQWTEHFAVMKLDPTPEWTRWLGISRKELDQRTFAEFLEDNAQDLTVPPGDAGQGFPTQQDLMSVASTLQIKSDVKFASMVKLQNGANMLAYSEIVDGGHGFEGKLPIPERFGLAIAPFRGTPKYLVIARLRYRGTGGKAAFRVEIERPHKIVEAAFNDVRSKITELTEIPVLVGSITPQVRPVI